jgi:alkanesulfonate monooxygenase SsuD/methylene tetrahydromethanopterin reductase-like flavin-dependent oxidoreductase (luciferase family)
MTRWGVLLPTFDPLRIGGPPRVVEAARLAEDLGFDAVWAGDHLACPAPVLDALTSLAAAAATTDRVALGLSVLLLGLRSPAWTAKQLVSLELLSGGRLQLGVGVGGEFPAEFAAAGVPVERRGARLNDALAVLPDLLQGRRVTTRGLDIAPLEPALDALPRILVGGRGEPALRRAARSADAWLPMWLTPDALARRAERLEELAAEQGRPRPDLALLVGVHVEEDLPRARRAADAHVRGQYGLDLERIERWTPLGGIDAVSEQLAAHRDAGVGEFVLMPLGADPLGQYERLAEVRARVQASDPVDRGAPT